jgi:hypothetical protein
MNKSRSLRCAGHVAGVEKTRNAPRILMGKPEGRRQLGKHSSRCKNHVKMVAKEIE